MTDAGSASAKSPTNGSIPEKPAGAEPPAGADACGAAQKEVYQHPDFDAAGVRLINSAYNAQNVNNLNAGASLIGSAINAGEIHNHFGSDARSCAGEYQLFEVSPDDLGREGHVADADLIRARDCLGRRRVLYLLYHDDQRNDCMRLRIALLRVLALPKNKLITAPTVDIVRCFAGKDLTPFEPFVLYLEEDRFEQVAGNVRYLTSPSLIGELQKKLTEFNSFAVIPVSSRLHRHADFADGVETFQFAPKASPKRESAVPPPAKPEAWPEEDRLAGMARFIATLLPGLSITQFDELMSRLLVAAQPEADAAAAAANGKNRRGWRQAAPANLAAQWQAEPDDVVARAGIVHCPTAFAESGYVLSDQEEAPALEAMLVQRRPAWLKRQLGLITQWFVESRTSSPAQQQGMKKLIVLLHAHKLAPVDREALWAQFGEVIDKAQTKQPAFARFSTLLTDLLLEPTTAQPASDFSALLADRCQAAASEWLDRVRALPEAAAWLASSGREPGQALLSAAARAALQSPAIRRLVAVQQLLISAMERVKIESQLPLLVRAASESEAQIVESTRFRQIDEMRFLAEPARTCMFVELDNWLRRNIHALPQLCVAAVGYMHQLEQQGAGLERRWTATVLLDAVLRAVYTQCRSWVFTSDAAAGESLRVLLGRPENDAFDDAFGAAICYRTQRLAGDKGQSPRYRPELGLVEAIDVLELLVCALQKMDPARSAATLARTRSLAAGFHRHLERPIRKDLPKLVGVLETLYRQHKDAPELRNDAERRRIWLWRMDTLRLLRGMPG